MTIGSIVFVLLIFCLIGGVILWIFGFISLKKRKNILAVIMLIIGLILFAAPTFMIFRIYTLIPKNNSSLEYDFSKDFTQLSKEFNEIYKSNKKLVVGINIEIIGYINGKGKLLIIHQPYEGNEGIILELEGKIYEKIENRDWYNPECLIKFIPDNEFVEGNIIINIEMY
jgi:hypothetical protein